MTDIILKTIANQTRIQLILCLSSGSKNVTQLISNCGLAQSAVSQHLCKLKKAGLVRTNKNGKEVFYSLKNPKTADLGRSIIKFIKEVDSK